MKRTIYSVFCLALPSVAALAQTTDSSANAETKKADPAAWNFLKSTRETSQNFPANFVSVTVDIVLSDNCKIAKGTLSYEAGEVAG